VLWILLLLLLHVHLLGRVVLPMAHHVLLLLLLVVVVRRLPRVLHVLG
jgi:hypothetical protein